MKKLLILFILIGNFCYAQEAPKGTSKIILKNNLSAKENYSLCIKNLIDNDIFIDASDSSTMYIKTQMKSLPHSMGSYMMNIVSKNNEIHISGNAKPAYTINFAGVTTTNDPEAIINKGMKGSYFRICFQQMLNFAQTFKYEILYK